MATLGQQLKQAREARGISLHEISDSTHIGIRFLQAIENDAYDVLPGGVFNRAFVRKFARVVGFDEEQAVNLYEEQLQEQGGEPDRPYRMGIEEFESRPTSGNGLLLSFVALIILGALAYAAYQYFSPVSDSGGKSTADLNAPTPAATEAPSPGVTPMASESPSPSPTAVASASPTPGPATAVASADSMRVRFAAQREEVWLSIKPDDQKVERMILQPGETREFDANEQVVLSIGRVYALKIAINGRDVNNAKLLPNPKAIQAKNVVITKGNYQQFLN
jgi:cytoskeletal protein RodZ